MFTKDIAFGEEGFWIAEVTDHPASLLLAVPGQMQGLPDAAPCISIKVTDTRTSSAGGHLAGAVAQPFEDLCEKLLRDRKPATGSQ